MKQLLGVLIITLVLFVIGFFLFTVYSLNSFGVGEEVTTDNKIQRYSYFRSEDLFGNVSVRKWNERVVGYVTYENISEGGEIKKYGYGKDTIRIAGNIISYTLIKKHYY